MLWTDKWGKGVQRTQAGQVAATLATLPRDTTVLVCPDQLGPSLLRYARSDLTYVSYPRGTRPDIVDWYDYTSAFAATSPGQFVSTYGHGRVALVWANGYNLQGTCRNVLRALAAVRGRSGEKLLTAKVQGFYQSMYVTSGKEIYFLSKAIWVTVGNLITSNSRSASRLIRHIIYKDYLGACTSISIYYRQDIITCGKSG